MWNIDLDTKNKVMSISLSQEASENNWPPLTGDLDTKDKVMSISLGQETAENNYWTPEGTFPFRYLSEKKLKQEN